MSAAFEDGRPASWLYEHGQLTDRGREALAAASRAYANRSDQLRISDEEMAGQLALDAEPTEADRCNCPDDCNCRKSWRPNYCGCDHE